MDKTQARSTFFIVKTPDSQETVSTFIAAQNLSQKKIKEGLEWADIFQVTKLQRQWNNASIGSTGTSPRVRKTTSKSRET